MQRAYGQLLFDTGRPREGLTAYRNAIDLAPARDAWRVRNDLARRLWEVGAIPLAAELLRTSVATAPDQEEPRHYLVLAYLTLGAYSDAAAAADSALAKGMAPPLFQRLRALADSARRDGAPPGSIRIRVNRPASGGRP
jgi:tetratricopeptide (TPR) repeat protein